MQYRFLVEIVAHHIRHISIHALVVGNPGARSIRQSNIPPLAGVQQPGRPQQRIGAKSQRVYKVIVNPAVDDIHPAQPFGSPHIDDAVADGKIAPLHQLGPQLPGQKDMLVKSGVVHAGSEQGDGRIRAPLRRQLPQCSQQSLPVVFHFQDAGTAVKPAQAGFGRLAVRQHIRHARRHPQVVLQHREPVISADQISAADGNPGAIGRRKAAQLGPILRAAIHQIRRNDAVADDAGAAGAGIIRASVARLPVHILQEHIEGFETLRQPGFNLPPVGGRHYARHAVYGNDALVGLIVPIDIKSDALVGKRASYPLGDAVQVVGDEFPQRIVELPTVFPRRAVGQQQLVIDGRVKAVIVEIHSGRPASAQE